MRRWNKHTLLLLLLLPMLSYNNCFSFPPSADGYQHVACTSHEHQHLGQQPLSELLTSSAAGGAFHGKLRSVGSPHTHITRSLCFFFRGDVSWTPTPEKSSLEHPGDPGHIAAAKWHFIVPLIHAGLDLIWRFDGDDDDDDNEVRLTTRKARRAVGSFCRNPYLTPSPDLWRRDGWEKQETVSASCREIFLYCSSYFPSLTSAGL